MGMQEILECLEKHKKPIARKQIAKDTGYHVIKVSHLIIKLLNIKNNKKNKKLWISQNIF